MDALSDVLSRPVDFGYSVQSHIDDYADETLSPVLTQLLRLRSLVFKPDLLPWSARQMELVDSALSTMLADVRERRNNLGPNADHVGVHRLPEEILCIIFECLVEYGDRWRSQSSATNLRSLLRVCRRWHRVASAKASIWRGVDFDLIPPAFLHSWLNRCATTPLCISTSHADPIISIRDNYPSFPGQVVGLTLRKNWYMGSTHRELVHSSTFPNVVYLHIVGYPQPDHVFCPASITGFSNLHTLNVECEYEFWEKDHLLPAGIEDLTIYLSRRESLSLSRLSRAIGSLRLLRRLDFKTGSSFFQDGGQRMRLSALEYVHLTLNPYYHYFMLDILPTFESRAYHLHIREKEGELYPDCPKELYSSFGAILKGHTISFTTVRFTLGLRYPIMSMEGGGHFSVSLEEHNPFGKRLALILNLFDLRCVREAILVEERLGNPRFYDMAHAFTLLRGVERLVIEGEVGPEASRLLIALGGSGCRYIFPHEFSHHIKWPALSSIHLHSVDVGFFHSSHFDGIPGLGLALWSIHRSGTPLRSVRITNTGHRERTFESFGSFIPNVLVESKEDAYDDQSITDSLPESWDS